MKLCGISEKRVEQLLHYRVGIIKAVRREGDAAVRNRYKAFRRELFKGVRELLREIRTEKLPVKTGIQPADKAELGEYEVPLKVREAFLLEPVKGIRLAPVRLLCGETPPVLA